MNKNLVANILGKLWGFISLYVFMPLYFTSLGSQSFGLIGLYTALASVIMIADFGISASINRQFATLIVSQKEWPRLPKVLRSYEIVYLFCLILIFSVFHLANSFFDPEFMNIDMIGSFDQAWLVYVMSFALLLQLFSSVYFNSLMGAERQISANVIQILWGMLRAFGSVVILVFFDADILDFFIWQLICNVIYLLVLYIFSWRLVRIFSQEPSVFSLFEITSNAKFMTGFMVISIISVAVTQLDKFVVVSVLDLTSLGLYTLAVSFAMIPIVIVSPIGLTLFPRFTSLISQNNSADLLKTFVIYRDLTCALLIPISVVILWFMPDILFLWLGDKEVVDKIAVPATYFFGAQVLQSLTLIGYYLILAKGKVKYNMYLGIITLVIYLPLCFWLTSLYGISGTAISYLIVNVAIFPLYVYFVRYKIIMEEGSSLISYQVIISLISSFLVIYLFDSFFSVGDSFFEKILFLAGLLSATALLSLATNPFVRRYFFEVFSGLRGRQL
jgi:O-antigen/teichoic acid export membrane protein